jgi:FMN hydrolase / 5-amino-6-(5-phospho-D-ribitylamino)uracil phosphatase
MRRFKLITFDLDDTLWHAQPAIERAIKVWFEFLARQFPRFGDHFDQPALLRLRQQLADHDDYRHRVSALRVALARTALQHCGYSQADAEQGAQRAFEVFHEARHQVTLFHDVEATLTALAQHYRLGVITNGNAQIARLGIDHHFEFAIAAEAINISKPDRRVFQHALQLGGVEAHEVVHVGDQPIDDIEGAQQAGLRTVWINRNHVPWPSAVPPDAEVHDIGSVIAAIMRLEQLPP